MNDKIYPRSTVTQLQSVPRDSIQLQAVKLTDAEIIARFSIWNRRLREREVQTPGTSVGAKTYPTTQQKNVNMV